MKKKLLFAATFAAGMLFTACSSDDNLLADVNEKPLSELFNSDGTAYMSLNIAAPSQSGDRSRVRRFAEEEEDNYGKFNDGENYEHTVETAVLVLFQGKDSEPESGYKYHSAYELKNTEWEAQTSNNQVTKTGKIVQKISKGTLGEGESLFAYIILNRHDFLKFNASGELTTKADESFAGKTFGDFFAYEIDETQRNFSKSSFTMTNMPYVEHAGGANAPGEVTPKTLYPVKSESIYSNETNANIGEATTIINVERVLAKVSVKATSTSVNTENDGQNSAGTILGWFVDNTNKQSYLSRHCAENVNTFANSAYGYLNYQNAATAGDYANKYRFVAENYIAESSKVYRTFWAVDKNYDDGVTTGLKTEAGVMVDNSIISYKPDGTIASGRLRPVGGYYYCTENTFNIDKQSVENTTRVVVAIQFNGGKDFYTVTPGVTGKIYDAETKKAEDEVLTRVLGRVSAEQWVEEYINKTKVTDLKTLFNVTITPNVTAEGDYTGSAAVTVELKELTTAQLKSGKSVDDATEGWNSQDNQTWVNNNITLSYYKGGVAYYAALIQHFGEHETPWAETPTMENTTAGVYGTNSKHFLGRYGVVRNNWYDIKITGVRTLGTPVVPELTPGIPDDQVEKFIKVEINITPWVIRTQNTKL